MAVTLEGTRPILLEMQSLVTTSTFHQPRRTQNGVDLNRLHLLLAVLGKRVGLQLHNQDVFVNIMWGMHINEPAADLAVAAAITSSFRGKAIPRDLALIGEIRLGSCALWHDSTSDWMERPIQSPSVSFPRSGTVPVRLRESGLCPLSAPWWKRFTWRWNPHHPPCS